MLSVTSSSLANSRPLSTWMRWISSSNSSAKVFTNFKGLFVIFSRTIVRVCFRRLKPATLHLIAQGDLCYAMFHRTQTESLTIAHFLLKCTLSCIIRSVIQRPLFMISWSKPLFRAVTVWPFISVTYLLCPTNCQSVDTHPPTPTVYWRLSLI